MKKYYLILPLLVFSFIPSNLFSQQVSDTSKVLVTFSEPMSLEGIFDVNNYSIFSDDETPIKIYKVGVVRGDSIVVLFTEKQSKSNTYKLIINNLKDKSGNIISENRKMVTY